MYPVSSYSSTNLIVTQAVNRNLNSMLGALTQLSTGSRINRGSDDPAGLIAAATIKSQLASNEALQRSNQRNSALLDVADSGLAEVARLTSDIRGNLITAASSTTTNAERAALQIEIDSAIDAIDLVGRSTYNDRPVFSGKSINVNYGPDYYSWEQLHLPKIDSATLGDAQGVLADLRSGGKYDLESGDLASALKTLNAVQSRTIYARAEYRAFDRYSHNSIYESLANQGLQLTSIYSELLDADYLNAASELARSSILAHSSLTAYQSLAAVIHTQHNLFDTLFNLNRR